MTDYNYLPVVISQNADDRGLKRERAQAMMITKLIRYCIKRRGVFNFFQISITGNEENIGLSVAI